MSDKPKKEKKEKKEKKPKKEKLPKPSSKQVKVCPACREEIPKKAKTCPHCAAKQKGVNPLVLVLPMLLVLLGGAAASVFVFHFPIAPPEDLYIPILSGPKMSETALGLGMGLTEKQEEAMLPVLESCGFQEISQVSQVASNDTSATYAVQDVDTERFMSTGDPILVQVEAEERTIQSIDYQGSTIYDGETVVVPITDFYLDMSERDRYMEAVLTEVKSQLALPEVAVFPSRSHWNFYEEDDLVIVESYVTTKDGSGEETVQSFLARFEKGSLVSVSFQDS